MIFHFYTGGHYSVIVRDKDGKMISATQHENVAALGTFCPLKKEDVKRYIKQFPIHWITI